MKWTPQDAAEMQKQLRDGQITLEQYENWAFEMADDAYEQTMREQQWRDLQIAIGEALEPFWRWPVRIWRRIRRGRT
jgi:hypothetical protein